MKPKLRVGDYAKVILDCNIKGRVDKVVSVEYGKRYPYTLLNSSCQWNDRELQKIDDPFNFLPPLTELEQYRLSLEVYKDLLIHAKGQHECDAEILSASITSIEINLLTEILNP